MGNTIKNWEKQKRREEKQMQQELQEHMLNDCSLLNIQKSGTSRGT